MIADSNLTLHKPVCMVIIHQHTKFGVDRFHVKKKKGQTVISEHSNPVALTKTLTIATKTFHLTLHLVMIHQHIEQLSNSEDRMADTKDSNSTVSLNVKLAFESSCAILAHDST